ncbi:hypothetical protein BIW11_03451 [Tropilaelaps mercedesae]|uniref:Uncharacterized protein n=1 Tax=Tropilaelaps mercedesae TaxID=418985 RepID=A0A1V9XLL9_9ACAR|nr:hypothetical protein BIW11_03451 [Tropilaelaps mercedesae]
MRHSKYEKAFLLAVDIESVDLFYDLCTVAKRSRLSGLVRASQRKIEELESSTCSSSFSSHGTTSTSDHSDASGSGSGSSSDDELDWGGREHQFIQLEPTQVKVAAATPTKQLTLGAGAGASGGSGGAGGASVATGSLTRAAPGAVPSRALLLPPAPTAPASHDTARSPIVDTAAVPALPAPRSQNVAIAKPAVRSPAERPALKQVGVPDKLGLASINHGSRRRSIALPAVTREEGGEMTDDLGLTPGAATGSGRSPVWPRQSTDDRGGGTASAGGVDTEQAAGPIMLWHFTVFDAAARDADALRGSAFSLNEFSNRLSLRGSFAIPAAAFQRQAIVGRLVRVVKVRDIPRTRIVIVLVTGICLQIVCLILYHRESLDLLPPRAPFAPALDPGPLVYAFNLLASGNHPQSWLFGSQESW